MFANYKANGALPENINLFLTLLLLLSAILIVAGNLVAGQLIERTKTKAGKVRPWILLASVLLGVACIAMFMVPMNNGTSAPVATMVLTAIAYNLYYSIAYPLYNTANSTLVPVSTRNGNQRGLLASFSNFANMGVMGAGGMVFPMIIACFLGGWESPNKTAWAVAFIAIGIVTAQSRGNRQVLVDSNYFLSSVPVRRNVQELNYHVFLHILRHRNRRRGWLGRNGNNKHTRRSAHGCCNGFHMTPVCKVRQKNSSFNRLYCRPWRWRSCGNVPEQFLSRCSRRSVKEPWFRTCLLYDTCFNCRHERTYDVDIQFDNGGVHSVATGKYRAAAQMRRRN